MRVFIVLCLVGVACADKLGYNYQPVGHSNNGLSFAPGASNGVPSYGDQGSNGPSYGDQGSNGPSVGGPGSIGSPSYGTQGSNGYPSNGPQGAGGPSNDAQGPNSSPSYAPQGELEKEYYIYSANDEDFHNPAATNQIVSSVKKGLRVVFIKGPDNRALEDAAINLAKQAADQKTDIYVLNKQADLADLARRLNDQNKNNNNKPEVHFVKYRTPEDAANAQKAIQSQYDSLGGPSKNIDGGVAPALNFVSQAPVHAPSAPAPRNNYLPASIFRY